MLTVKRNRITILAAAMIFIILAVTTCNTQVAKTDDNNEMRLKVLSIYNEQNYEVIDEIYSDSVILHHSSYPEDIVGKEGILNFAKSNATGFPDFKLTIDKFYPSEDIMFSFWVGEGTNTGTFNDMPPTGNKIKVWGMSASRIVNGKIVEEWIVLNALDFMNQLNPPAATEEESTE